MTKADLIVLGAGPAGLAAAATAAGCGLDVILIDEQQRPGGQIYRDVDRVLPLRGEVLGPDYATGARLTGGIRQDTIRYVPGACVWQIEPGFSVTYSGNGGGVVTGDRLLLATGALERAMPLPGWTLPGVMTAGAGQILLKQSGLVAQRAVLVGTGPLLFLVAAQMVRAGTPPLALVETQTRADLARAARHVGGAMRGWRYLAKGLDMHRTLARAGVPRHVGATQVEIAGPGAAEAVTFHCNGRRHRIDCDTVFLHHGVIPNTQAARSLDIGHRWDVRQHAFAPVLDGWGESDMPGVFIAGDGAGIGGATLAELAGRLAALRIAESLGKVSPAERDRQAAPLRRALEREAAVRPFLDTAYPPFAEALQPADDTVVCRCEEVTAGDIRGFARLGCTGPNQAKAFGRVGMGPCQGRICGPVVTELLAKANGQSPDATGYVRIRPPLKPVTLGELAQLAEPDPEAKK
ncbi:Sarcosine oxidase alpha subunit [Rhodovulum sp. P5]|uniref:FAD/NAD(P)-dependent oxidoreductase n=1 Tax=Rhodovulum sp. P5 TaxID=1564506 RepID=UPI0009C3D19A|nr:NAD(P)/FAD-dependent oxidoreductase [Rhodovulum sp. P5]ARE38359.1 Sarcosine oxidase alpha subunit [Rhodovulum sp. P5]